MRKGLSPAIAFVLIVMITVTGAMALYFWVGGNTLTPAFAYLSVTVSAYPYNSTSIVLVNDEARNSSEYTHLNTTVGRCDFGDPTNCSDTRVLVPGVPTRCYLRTPTCDTDVTGPGRVAIYGEGINTVYVSM
jgi:flagellin-like protein